MHLKEILKYQLPDNFYPVRDKNNKIIASLSLITGKDLEDLSVIEKITLWRDKYRNCFLSEFTPTFERTSAWMKNILLPDQDRALFKIFTAEGTFVGHIGAILHNDFIEYDYFIKGEKVEIPDFSLTLARRFLMWICEITGRDVIKGNVRSDNKAAMDFHLRTGFKVNRKLPLIKKYSSTDEFCLVVAEESQSVQDVLFLNEIIMKKEDIIL